MPSGYRAFAWRPDQLAAARDFASSVLLPGTQAYETTRLLVDEAVTNPLLHSARCDQQKRFQVNFRLNGDGLRVEVRDGGVPFLRPHDGQHPPSVAGRGLELFDALAAEWDSAADRNGHVVWFELPA